MGRHAKTQRLIDTAIAVLTEIHPMTVRQVYYQLVSRQVIENSRTAYQSVSTVLVDARRAGAIPWEWIEDRNRRPRTVPMWENPATFAEAAVRSYRRDVWATQPGYLEVWLEKDALSGVVSDVTTPYGITLCVGRGYDGWSSIHAAATRYQERQADGQDVTVLYLGDFDPSGEDMVRSLRERLASLDALPTISKIALTPEQIRANTLPPDFTKATDSRRAGFVTAHGDVSVELDALPIPVLQALLLEEVQYLMDLEELQDALQRQNQERARIQEALTMLGASA